MLWLSSVNKDASGGYNLRCHCYDLRCHRISRTWLSICLMEWMILRKWNYEHVLEIRSREYIEKSFCYEFVVWWCPKIRIHLILGWPDYSDMIRYVSNKKYFSVKKSCFIMLIKVSASIFLMWMLSILFTYQGPRCINSVMSISDLLHNRN